MDQKNKRPDFEKLFGDKKPDQSILRLLNDLFDPHHNNSPRTLGNKLYFNRYFNLAMFPNEFSSQQFRACMALPFPEIKEKLHNFYTSNTALFILKLNEELAYYTRFRNRKNLILALLFLYNFACEEQRMDSEEYDTLEDAIAVLANSYEGNITSKYLIDLLKESVGKNDYKTIFRFSRVFNLENLIRSKGSRLELLQKSDNMFLFFNQFFIDETINELGNKFDPVILKYLQEIILLLKYGDENGSTTRFQSEFFSNVAGFLDAHIDELIDHIKNECIKSNLSNLQDLKKYIESFVFNIANLEDIAHPNLEKLIDLYNGFDTIEINSAIFNNRLNDSTEKVDSKFQKLFEMNLTTGFQINIMPSGGTWHFGLMFSTSKFFPEDRNSKELPLLVLTNGRLNDYSKLAEKQSTSLFVTMSNRDEALYQKIIQDKYDNSRILISLKFNSAGFLLFSCVSNGESFRSKYQISAETRYMKILAWSDETKDPVQLYTRTKVGRKLPLLGNEE